MKQIKAPFTQDQVNHINEFQNSNLVHPFTCGNDSTPLIAQRDGLHCPNCDYKQDWVHDAMADGSFLAEVAAVFNRLDMMPK
jgi:hypothetical protein